MKKRRDLSVAPGPLQIADRRTHTPSVLSLVARSTSFGGTFTFGLYPVVIQDYQYKYDSWYCQNSRPRQTFLQGNEDDADDDHQHEDQDRNGIKLAEFLSPKSHCCLRDGERLVYCNYSTTCSFLSKNVKLILMKNFWQTLQKPILALAPLADVTDAAFRRIIAKYGKPDVMWTEFVSADGLVLAPEKGKKKLLLDLVYSEEERPIVAQFFTSKPEMMEKAAALAVKLGFDGVDINMGCPDRSVEKQGAGAALIKTPELAQELILATKRGVESAGSGIPVSVKTRLGYNKDELETWLPALLETKPDALIIHARTRKEMSKVPAHWDRIKRAVEIRDELVSKTLILGNGDVEDLAHARKIADETGADGIMLGRAIFGNPFLFAPQKEESGIKNQELWTKRKIEILIEHIKLFDELLACPPKPSAKAGGYKSFAVMKKHFKTYLVGLNISDQNLRHKLMETKTAEESVEILEAELSTRGLQ